MKNFDKLYEKTKKDLPDDFNILETIKYRSLTLGQTLALIVILPILVSVVPAIILKDELVFINCLIIYVAFFMVVLFIIGIIDQRQSHINAPRIYRSIFTRMLCNYNDTFHMQEIYNSSEQKLYIDYGLFEKVSEFHISDKIIGYIENNIEMTLCDIKVYGKTTDASINDDFVGLFCVFKLPFDTNSVIALRSDVRKNSFTGKQPKLQMDNQTFEKTFNVYASDSILAMRIFTADFMQYILDYHDGKNPPFVFTINRDKLLIRIRTGRDSFELPPRKKLKDVLEADFSAIDTACNICSKIYTNISEKEL